MSQFSQFVPHSGRVWAEPDIRTKGPYLALCSLLATKNGDTFTSWAIAVTISDPDSALQHELFNNEALICLTA